MLDDVPTAHVQWQFERSKPAANHNRSDCNVVIRPRGVALVVALRVVATQEGARWPAGFRAGGSNLPILMRALR